MNVFEQLKRPFPVSKIRWRIGRANKQKTSATALAYIDARDVMHRLDTVVGPQNWQCRYPLSDSGLLICEIGIAIESQWVWKANGAGDTQVEAEKGKASDAFKRAAVLWGIGRYLYEFPEMWVPVENINGYLRLPDSSIDLLTNRLGVGNLWWADPEKYDEVMAKKEAA